MISRVLAGILETFVDHEEDRLGVLWEYWVGVAFQQELKVTEKFASDHGILVLNVLMQLHNNLGGNCALKEF